ncbi:MAG: hypothetical protein ACRERU_05330 [Methylococcales bacterium]
MYILILCIVYDAYIVLNITRHIEIGPQPQLTPGLLLRESFRDHGKIRKRALANLTHGPSQLVGHFRVLLRGGVAVILGVRGP